MKIASTVSGGYRLFDCTNREIVGWMNYDTVTQEVELLVSLMDDAGVITHKVNGHISPKSFSGVIEGSYAIDGKGNRV